MGVSENGSGNQNHMNGTGFHDKVAWMLTRITGINVTVQMCGEIALHWSWGD